MVLSFILVQNRQGKTRLAKWYAPYTDEEKVKLKGEVRSHNSSHSITLFLPCVLRSLVYSSVRTYHRADEIPPCLNHRQVHRLIAPRDQKYQSNFVEFRSAPSSSSSSSGGHQPLVRQNLSSTKIVYRRYAGLFFCVCVDANDNELAYLEAIHFFVEVLDQFFGNVCELDLVFNFYKVYAILDEVFLAGEIEETSKQVVLTRLEHLDKLE